MILPDQWIDYLAVEVTCVFRGVIDQATILGAVPNGLHRVEVRGVSRRPEHVRVWQKHGFKSAGQSGIIFRDNSSVEPEALTTWTGNDGEL